MQADFSKYAQWPKLHPDAGSQMTWRVDKIDQTVTEALIERFCSHTILNHSFVIKEHISWYDVFGFNLHKVNSRNIYLDLCVLESPEGYAVFDMFFKRQDFGQGAFCLALTYEIHEYALSPEDEMILRLSL